MLRTLLVMLAAGLCLNVQAQTNVPQQPNTVVVRPNDLEKDKEHWYKQMEDLEYLQTRDPNTNTVPKERLFKQIEQLHLEEAKNIGASKVEAPASTDKWIELGPSNNANSVAGRVRALYVTPGGKNAFAAGVSGGIWRCYDITAPTPVWVPIGDKFANLAITCIAAQPGSNVMYFGTGEGWSNPTTFPAVSPGSFVGVFLRGAGIWKSTDGGSTWNLLTNTGTANPDFYYVQKITVKSDGTVFAATLNGLFRSTNGGTNWTKVLSSGNGASVNSAADVKIASDGNIYVSMGIRESDGVYRSTNANNGQIGTWTKIFDSNNPPVNSLPGTGVHRIELACVPNNPNMIYLSACNNILPPANNATPPTYDPLTYTHHGELKGIYFTTNATGASVTWQNCSMLPTQSGPVTNPTAVFYANCIVADPNTPSGISSNSVTLYAGYRELYRSTNGGGTWTQIANMTPSPDDDIHVDQHIITFAAAGIGSTNMYIGNDGGISRCTNFTAPSPVFSYINKEFNISQFFTCSAIATANVPDFSAGAQDNAIQRFTSFSFNNSTKKAGGDGSYCFYPTTTKKIYSVFGGLTYRETNDTLFSYIAQQDEFIGAIPPVPKELSQDGNTLYCSAGNNQIFRYTNVLSSPITKTIITISQMNNKRASYIKVSPNNPSTIYIGTEDGRVIRLTNANTVPATPLATDIKQMVTSLYYISSIDVKTDNTAPIQDDEIVITCSNYGVSSVFYCSNGTNASPTFNNIDNLGLLGDIPVRCAIFAPNNNTQGIKMLLGTELGVWATDAYNGTSTVWYRFSKYLPYVRTDMLKIRPSDNLMLAATFGRGLFRSDIFSNTKINFIATNPNINITCPLSLQSTLIGANNPRWDITGDGVSEPEYDGLSNISFCWNPLQRVTLFATIAGTAQSVSVSYLLKDIVNGNGTISCGNNECSIIPTGNKVTFDDITIYPNPTPDGKFHIGGGQGGLASVIIYTIDGKKIAEGTEALSLEYFPPGVYIINVLDNWGYSYSKQIIRE